MLSVEEVFNKLEEIPHLGNSTALEKFRTFVENTSRQNVINWMIVLAIAGVVFSLLTFAIVYKSKAHKRRELRWRKSSFQERKCSSCRSPSCEHRSFTNFNR